MWRCQWGGVSGGGLDRLDSICSFSLLRNFVPVHCMFATLDTCSVDMLTHGGLLRGSLSLLGLPKASKAFALIVECRRSREKHPVFSGRPGLFSG